MVATALLGAVGAGAANGAASITGGTAGPAKSGITSDSTFNIGGNTGIGSSSGGLLSGLTSNPQSLAMVGLIAIGVAIVLTRGRR